MKKQILFLASILILATYILLVSYISPNQEKKWVAPKSADKIENPLKNDPNSAVRGKKLFRAMCVVCHGTKGKGDGMAGAGLTPKPANFTKTEFQNQTDGAIFWKLTEGRSPMASYKELLDETQRWHIVNYLRTLKK
ncbi:c-type cytochrome [Lutibacter sp.]